MTSPDQPMWQEWMLRLVGVGFLLCAGALAGDLKLGIADLSAYRAPLALYFSLGGIGLLVLGTLGSGRCGPADETIFQRYMAITAIVSILFGSSVMLVFDHALWLPDRRFWVVTLALPAVLAAYGWVHWLGRSRGACPPSFERISPALGKLLRRASKGSAARRFLAGGGVWFVVFGGIAVPFLAGVCLYYEILRPIVAGETWVGWAFVAQSVLGSLANSAWLYFSMILFLGLTGGLLAVFAPEQSLDDQR